MDENQFRESYTKYEIMREHLQALLQQKEMIDSAIAELMSTIDSLEKLKSSEKGNKFLSPLGSGSFLESTMDDTKHVLIGIGADIVTRETREKAVDMLKGRLEQMVSSFNELIKEASRIASELSSIEEQLQEFAQNAKE